MGVAPKLELRPIADPGDPDDWRPNSRWALASDPDTSMAVIVEELAAGDAIPLHVHSIDEVLLYDVGRVEVQLGRETHAVAAGAIVFVPAGTPHATRNTGDEPARVRAVFPSHVIDIRYVERNPAPGTEGAAPQPPVAYDARTGEVTTIE